MEPIRLQHENTATHPAAVMKPLMPNPQYRNVVVALDLGPGSEALLAAAAAVAPSARITAVHAYDVPHEGMLRRAGVPSPEIHRHRGDAIAAAVERIDEMASALPGGARVVVALVQRADPVRLVLDAARSLKADLVVLASRRRSVVERLLVGSVSRRIIAGAPCDVLVPPLLPRTRAAS